MKSNLAHCDKPWEAGQVGTEQTSMTIKHIATFREYDAFEEWRDITLGVRIFFTIVVFVLGVVIGKIF